MPAPAARPSIAVTGSTGRLGGRVARRLADRGTRQRLLVRDVARAPQLPRVDVAVAPYDRPDAVRDTLTGVPTVFMVSASESPDRVDQHRSFVDAAVAAGVGHLVYLSFLGAAPDATFTLARDHWATEEHIRASGLPFTFLRDSLYADFLPGMIGDDGVLRGPAGDGRVAAVAQDDVADVATAVLTDPAAFAGTTLELTGPQALSLAEVAAVIAAASERDIRYQPETVAEAFASRAGSGAPDWQIAAWVSTYTAIAAGELALVTDTVERITGRPATTVEQVVAASS
ncbi:SDR family oxidoreductase [Nakamurella leprariae]|uniref:SDR family oxidoreductase n=1 Tax=Nakamurella leprariae TaxID=2803911 RepID=UPI002E283392|nr:SDR family oxidoreductase [Nakamurella leprariae]